MILLRNNTMCTKDLINKYKFYNKMIQDSINTYQSMQRINNSEVRKCFGDLNLLCPTCGSIKLDHCVVLITDESEDGDNQLYVICTNKYCNSIINITNLIHIDIEYIIYPKNTFLIDRFTSNKEGCIADSYFYPSNYSEYSIDI